MGPLGYAEIIVTLFGTALFFLSQLILRRLFPKVSLYRLGDKQISPAAIVNQFKVHWLRLFMWIAGGFAASFVLSLSLTAQLWKSVEAPAHMALRTIGAFPELVQITPREPFSIIWLKLPAISATFLVAPCIFYRLWRLIAPVAGDRERTWGSRLILSLSAAYAIGGVLGFMLFRFALTFLLSIGRSGHVQPMVSLTAYFDLFANSIVGLGLVFLLPVFVFSVLAVRIASPRLLMTHRASCLGAILLWMGILTPTPDALNLCLLTVPMYFLFHLAIVVGHAFVARLDAAGSILSAVTATFLSVVVDIVLLAACGLILLLRSLLVH